DTDCFQHRARFIAEPGHIEITLVSKTEQVVSVGGRAFAFAPGETIHVENSHKYGVAEFAELAGDAGFDVTKVWTDENKLFSVQLITAKA
ncbi:MAG: L-histidine N(alpha)-methyltransferase, partial [Novosphingobium sp.]